MNFVDRILRTAWRLVLLLLVLAILLPMAGQLIGGAISVVSKAVIESLGPLLGSGLIGIPLVAFLVGLGVRLVRSAGDPNAVRRRQADRMRMRRTTRRRAEDIPPYGEARRVPPDEDPTLPFEDV